MPQASAQQFKKFQFRVEVSDRNLLQWDITSRQLGLLFSKEQLMIRYRETGNFMHCSWECKMVQTLWLLKQLNIQLPYDSAILLSSIYINTKVLKGGTWTDICMPVLTATLFTTAKRWKQTKRPLVDEQRTQMWHSYTMQYCAAMRRDENLIFAILWMDFKKIMLTE